MVWGLRAQARVFKSCQFQVTWCMFACGVFQMCVFCTLCVPYCGACGASRCPRTSFLIFVSFHFPLLVTSGSPTGPWPTGFLTESRAVRSRSCLWGAGVGGPPDPPDPPWIIHRSAALRQKGDDAFLCASVPSRAEQPITERVKEKVADA